MGYWDIITQGQEASGHQGAEETAGGGVRLLQVFLTFVNQTEHFINDTVFVFSNDSKGFSFVIINLQIVIGGST